MLLRKPLSEAALSQLLLPARSRIHHQAGLHRACGVCARRGRSADDIRPNCNDKIVMTSRVSQSVGFWVNEQTASLKTIFSPFERPNEGPEHTCNLCLDHSDISLLWLDRLVLPGGHVFLEACMP
jgi:hypothetical protein